MDDAFRRYAHTTGAPQGESCRPMNSCMPGTVKARRPPTPANSDVTHPLVPPTTPPRRSDVPTSRRARRGADGGVVTTERVARCPGGDRVAPRQRSGVRTDRCVGTRPSRGGIAEVVLHCDLSGRHPRLRSDGRTDETRAGPTVRRNAIRRARRGADGRAVWRAVRGSDGMAVRRGCGETASSTAQPVCGHTAGQAARGPTRRCGGTRSGGWADRAVRRYAAFQGGYPCRRGGAALRSHASPPPLRSDRRIGGTCVRSVRCDGPRSGGRSAVRTERRGGGRSGGGGDQDDGSRAAGLTAGREARGPDRQDGGTEHP